MTFCALAESDHVMTDSEASEIAGVWARIARRGGSIVATAETAAGIHLMGEVTR